MTRDDLVTQCVPHGAIMGTPAMDIEASQVLVRGQPFFKVVHVYKIGMDQNMYCLDCGKNIIDTPYGDSAYHVGERQPMANEIVCRDAIRKLCK